MSARPKRRWADSRRINVMEAADIEFWTKFLGVDSIELLTAIDKVGTSVDSVKTYLDVEGTMLWIANGGRVERRRIYTS
jgi:uncharacterized protein DUF3606